MRVSIILCCILFCVSHTNSHCLSLTKHSNICHELNKTSCILYKSKCYWNDKSNSLKLATNAQRRRMNAMDPVPWREGFDNIAKFEEYEKNIGLLGEKTSDKEPGKTSTWYRKSCSTTLLWTKQHLITSAHCLFRSGEWHKELAKFKWFPALDADADSNGRIDATTHLPNYGIINGVVMRGWTETHAAVIASDPRPVLRYDIAILTLDNMVADGRIGLGLGYFDWAGVHDQPQLALYGYPGTSKFRNDYHMKKDPFVRDCVSVETIGGCADKTASPFINYVPNTRLLEVKNKRIYPAMSGGPWIKSRDHHILAITREWNAVGNTYDISGVPLTRAKIESIVHYVEGREYVASDKHLEFIDQRTFESERTVTVHKKSIPRSRRGSFTAKTDVPIVFIQDDSHDLAKQNEQTILLFEMFTLAALDILLGMMVFIFIVVMCGMIAIIVGYFNDKWL